MPGPRSAVRACADTGSTAPADAATATGTGARPTAPAPADAGPSAPATGAADIRDAVSPDEILFVVDAMIGQDAVN
ncbi:hypothetical protein AB0N19_40425, partial [Streptomyces sp. NPDC051132]|uniref:hypothetical protein n=1 Tax=Streptomyces sp. NPDC051132 TaxID=3155667 RepID=UPI0034395CF1